MRRSSQRDNGGLLLAPTAPPVPVGRQLVNSVAQAVSRLSLCALAGAGNAGLQEPCVRDGAPFRDSGLGSLMINVANNPPAERASAAILAIWANWVSEAVPGDNETLS